MPYPNINSPGGACLVGLAAGAFNDAATAFLRLPPIIATLASFFVFQSLAGLTGGAALSMSDTHLMESIAAIVLGGTSVAAGQSAGEDSEACCCIAVGAPQVSATRTRVDGSIKRGWGVSAESRFSGWR